MKKEELEFRIEMPSFQIHQYVTDLFNIIKYNPELFNVVRRILGVGLAEDVISKMTGNTAFDRDVLLSTTLYEDPANFDKPMEKLFFRKPREANVEEINKIVDMVKGRYDGSKTVNELNGLEDKERQKRNKEVLEECLDRIDNRMAMEGKITCGKI